MTKEIPLTRGQIALVDDWRYEELRVWKWFAYWDPHTGSYYARRREGNQVVHMHRVVAGTPPGMICDHINHKTLDCQEHNLRNVTHSQNAMNRRFRSRNQLGERCIYPDGSRFRVLIQKDGSRVFSKRFNSLEEAIAARDEALEEYHGEFSGLLVHRKETEFLSS